MIEEALGYAAVVWVALSWAKIWITPRMPVYKYLCSKCATFWVTLAFTWNPFVAGLAALIAIAIDRFENNTTITL